MQCQKRANACGAWLWLLAAIVLLGGLGGLVPIDQTDFWWHLALGRRIVAEGAVPRVADQSWLLPPDTPFIYGSWLAEWLLFRLYQLGGLEVIVTTRNLLLAGLLLLVGLEARRRSGAWLPAALAAGGVGLMILNNVSVRPQIFAWLPFAALTLLLGAVRGGQARPAWLVLAVPLMIFWVNVHGTFVLGLALLGLTALGETLRRWRGGAWRRSPCVRWLWGATLAGALSLLINPYGWRILVFVRNLVGHPTVQQLSNEWQPPDLLAFPGVLLPLALVVIALGVVRSRRCDLTDAMLLGAFTLLGVSAVRSLIWFAIVAWPIAAGALWRERQPALRQAPPVVTAGLTTALLALFVLLQPPFKPLLRLPAVFSGLGASVADGWLIGAGTPVQAVDWLRAHPLPPQARLFHEMRYGSYLMWALPEQRVALDGRLELYPYALWLRYLHIVEDEAAPTELERLGATHALLSRAHQPKLIARLERDRAWRQVYADQTAVIFERTTLVSQP